MTTHICGQRTTMWTKVVTAGPSPVRGRGEPCHALRAPDHPGGQRIAALVLIAAIAALLLGGCATGNRGASATRTPAPRSTAPAANSPPLSGVTSDAQAQRGCSSSSAGSRLSIAEVRVGTWDSWQQLPSDLPLKPLPTSIAKDVGNLALNAITVELDLATPASSAPGYICAITARMVSYQPLAAPIPNITRNCADHAYLNPGGPDYVGNCGFVTAPTATATTVFTQSAAGVTITMPIQNVAAPGQPAAFPTPGAGASKIWLTLKVAASGHYTFVVGLWQDNTGPSLTTKVSETFVLDAAHEWTGLSCKDPKMQAQLPPPTNPPTPLLCPGASPPVE